MTDHSAVCGLHMPLFGPPDAGIGQYALTSGAVGKTRLSSIIGAGSTLTDYAKDLIFNFNTVSVFDVKILEV